MKTTKSAGMWQDNGTEARGLQRQSKFGWQQGKKAMEVSLGAGTQGNTDGGADEIAGWVLGHDAHTQTHPHLRKPRPLYLPKKEAGKRRAGQAGRLQASFAPSPSSAASGRRRGANHGLCRHHLRSEPAMDDTQAVAAGTASEEP